jgi:hypothetical protein
MVRAAGLYPAGSRFESWLPYQLSPSWHDSPFWGILVRVQYASAANSRSDEGADCVEHVQPSIRCERPCGRQ